MKNSESASVAMSIELRAFVQMVVAEEHRISQSNIAQADEIISVTRPEVSAQSLTAKLNGPVRRPVDS